MNNSSLVVALLLLLFAPLTFADQSNDYAQGYEALQKKDLDIALSAFNRCIAADKSESNPTTAECWWEKGWAHWLQADWQKTVDAWTAVSRLNPSREDLQDSLQQAQDHLHIEQQLAQSGEQASESFSTTDRADANASVLIRAVGDMMLGTDFPKGYLPPQKHNSFGDLLPVLRGADVTFGNLEGPICSRGTTKKCKAGAADKSCYAFRTPPSFLQQYSKAGFDLLSTANNHALDFGATCRLQTEKLLDAAGIAHSGRPGDIASIETNGLKVVMIGFHSSPSSHHLNNSKTAAKLVRKLAQKHDLVIVSFHGGAEGIKALHVPHRAEKYFGENRGELRKFTHLVVDAGADLVLGHGPHVLRAIEVYKGRLIAYSLGNFATYGRFNLSGLLSVGAILEVRLAADGRFLAGRLIATRQKAPGVPYLDSKKQAVNLIRKLSAEDFPTRGIRVAKDGTIQVP